MTGFGARTGNAYDEHQLMAGHNQVLAVQIPVCVCGGGLNAPLDIDTVSRASSFYPFVGVAADLRSLASYWLRGLP